MSRSRPQTGRPRSRHRFQVATSKRGRDTVPPAQPQARSRHQNQVVTLLETNLCRDIKFMSRPRSCSQWDFQVATPKSMSRPPTLSPMSRHLIHVAMPFLPNKRRPGRDFTSWSHLTSNQTRSYPAQPGRDTHFWS